MAVNLPTFATGRTGARNDYLQRRSATGLGKFATGWGAHNDCPLLRKSSAGHRLSYLSSKVHGGVPHVTETMTDHIPVYVMLALGTISMTGELIDRHVLRTTLEKLKDEAKIDGVMIDVWWGIVERDSPLHYDWSGYRDLFSMVRELGLQLQVVMSFHRCGGNVGDDVFIPLPKWILEVGQHNPDIYFTDKKGQRNDECLSWGVDLVGALRGRTALEVYTDYMMNFRSEFDDFIRDGTIAEIEIGMGPCGELRFPSYPEMHGWSYPGIGEFQCYDSYLRSSLKMAADVIGEPAWAEPPTTTGEYVSKDLRKLDFFKDKGHYNGFRGRFFLHWYSGLLLGHADLLLAQARRVFGATPIAAKVAGVHWHYRTESHAAELTAGFYNTLGTSGYASIMSTLERHGAALNFTCVELRTKDQNMSHPDARADPEGLVWQVLQDAWAAGVSVAAENALPCYHRSGYDKILQIARPLGAPRSRPRLSAFTYLRLTAQLLEDGMLKEFARFVHQMHGEKVVD